MQHAARLHCVGVANGLCSYPCVDEVLLLTDQKCCDQQCEY